MNDWVKFMWQKKTVRGGMFSYQRVIIFVRNIFFEVGRMFASLEESRRE